MGLDGPEKDTGKMAPEKRALKSALPRARPMKASAQRPAGRFIWHDVGVLATKDSKVLTVLKL
jgi:hypothetical protein